MDRAKHKDNNDFQPFTVGTQCHILRMRPVWQFRRQTWFYAESHVLNARKRCRYAEGLETKVVLIDGVQVAELMFEYGVGVSTESTYVVKRIDSDFFEDEGGLDVAPEAATK